MTAQDILQGAVRRDDRQRERRTENVLPLPFRSKPRPVLADNSPMTFHQSAAPKRLVLPTRSCEEICLEKGRRHPDPR